MQRFKNVTRWVLGLSLLLAHTSVGQTDVRALEGLLKGQQKALRNFSGDPIAQYKWKDGTLQAEEPAVHTLAVFTMDSISQQGEKIELRGKRTTLIFDSRKKALGFSIREPMKLELDLTGATTSDALPKLIGLLFFPSLKDAVAGVPQELANRIPYDVGARKGPKQLGQMVYEDNSWKRLEFGDPRYKPPILVSAPEPEFTEEARRQRYSASETVFFKLSETGQQSDLWVASPIDFGLNARTVTVVRRYVFKPATLDDKPVATLLGVEVSFMMH